MRKMWADFQRACLTALCVTLVFLAWNRLCGNHQGVATIDVFYWTMTGSWLTLTWMDTKKNVEDNVFSRPIVPGSQVEIRYRGHDILKRAGDRDYVVMKGGEVIYTFVDPVAAMNWLDEEAKHGNT